LIARSDKEFQKLGKIIAYQHSCQLLAGVGDSGVLIGDTHLRAGIEIAAKCRDLAQELALRTRCRLEGADELTEVLNQL